MQPTVDHTPTPLPAREILRRRVDFEFNPTKVPENWFHGDLHLSLFLDALSLLFPEGERFFVESVQHFRGRITDPVLARHVVGFSGQEAMHGKEHRAFNEMLRGHGLRGAPRREDELRALLAFVRRILPPKARLAATCALEHFTSIMAEQLLGNERLRLGMHPSVRALWVWHALEESEHKAVAFDVYRAAGGSYPLRVVIMLLATVVFFAEVFHVHARFLAEKRALFRPRAWIRGFAFMWWKPGFFGALIPAYLDYFRPGFHPNDRDTDALLDEWTDRLFGKNGEFAVSPAIH